MKTISLGILLAAALIAFPLGAAAEDVEGSADHPLVGRYKDASIVFYKVADFDEQALLQGPHDYGALLERKATDDRSGSEWLAVEGRTTHVRYEIPEGRSSLEVIRNYQDALKANGFTVAFSCADKKCFTGSLQDNYLLGEQLDPTNGISTAYSDHARYFLAKLDRPEGAVYTSIFAGEDKERVVAFVTVVEAKPMQGDQITVIKAEEMQSTIDSGRSVDLYGIEFDFDKATLRPESKPTLDEIAKLLAAKPELNLNIVGHTDNKGTDAYNLDLSSRRAASVVAEMTTTYSIDPSRLTSEGAGMGRPVAPNDTEEGRAKNRRVELVAK